MKIGFIVLLFCLLSDIKAEMPWVLDHYGTFPDSEDTMCVWRKYDRLYYHFWNMVKITTQKKKPITLQFDEGIVHQINDSIFELYPTCLCPPNVKIKRSNELVGSLFTFSNIIPLPDAEIYIKGIPYEEGDTIKGMTIDNLMRHNQLEARFGDYMFKIISGNFEIFYGSNYQGSFILNQSTTIPEDQIKSLKINHQPIYLRAHFLNCLGPDSMQRELGRDKLIATIYRDSTEMLLERYKHIFAGNILKSDLRIAFNGNPTEVDQQTIKRIIQELNPLLREIKIKLVDRNPTLTINFKQPVTMKWESGFFSDLLFKIPDRSSYLMDQYCNTQRKRDLFLWEVVIFTLTAKSTNPLFFDLVGTNFFFNRNKSKLPKNKLSLFVNNETPGLTREGRIIIESLYSSDYNSKINKDSENDSPEPLPVLFIKVLLLIITFFALYELNNYYGYTARIKKAIFKYCILGIILAQPLILLTTISQVWQELHPLVHWVPLIPQTGQAPLLYNIKVFSVIFILQEIEFGLLAILVSLLFLFSDWILGKIKLKWLRLGLNPLLTILLFYFFSQISYLYTQHEFYKFTVLESEVVLACFLMVAIRFYVQYENAKITSLMQEKEYELTKQKELKTRADLNALQARINPHFLYNALNSIAALSRIDSKRTENMVLSLSKLFRYNLNREEEWIIPLGKEIDMVKLYLDIEKQRFSDRLSFSIAADENLLEIPIPRFIIQPLVENAIKHGIAKIAGQGNIQLKVYKEVKFLVIEIHDNGPAFPEGLLSGYGLQNMYDKLSLIHKKPYEVRFNNEPEKFVQIKLQ